VTGDFQQLLPVVRDVNEIGAFNASVKFSHLWDLFESLPPLTENMRVAEGEVEHREFLSQVGQGNNYIPGTLDVEIPEANVVHDLNKLIDFVYPPDTLADPLAHGQRLCEGAILCPTNAGVKMINAKIMERMPGETKVYLGLDTDKSNDRTNELNVHQADSQLEVIHDMTPDKMPPYKLELKVGMIVMCIRNLDAYLVNGTRLQIVAMTEENLKCRILTGSRASVNTEVLLPRIKFQHGFGKFDRGAKFERIQFPVRPAAAMTVHKAQGQTLSRAGLYLGMGQIFAHGMFYVFLSRVRRGTDYRILTRSGNLVKNIVCKPALRRRDRNDNDSFYDDD
jgi:hypothetical protein